MSRKVKITEYDIIKEVGSICGCNATLAFSQMIGRTIQLEAPRLEIYKFDDVGKILNGDEKMVVGVHSQILSGVLGQISLLFREKSAYEFVSIFAAKKEQSCGFLTELGISTIKEIGNVVVSAYVGAMSLLLDVSVIPSIPVLSSGPISQVIKFGFNRLQKKEKLYVHTMTFKDAARKIGGTFYLLLDLKTVRQISETMRRQLDEIEFGKGKKKKA